MNCFCHYAVFGEPILNFALLNFALLSLLPFILVLLLCLCFHIFWVCFYHFTARERTREREREKGSDKGTSAVRAPDFALSLLLWDF